MPKIMIKGVWTALITPFSENNEIDFKALNKILLTQVEAGVQGVVVCGTTAESPTLSDSEKKTLIQFVSRELQGTPLKILAGTGTNDTRTTLEFSHWASDQGVDGLLIVTPYYNKPSQSGLERHFTEIANASKLPIILYNVPGRTGVSLSPETIAKLAQHPQIHGLKEATGNVSFSSEILDQIKIRQTSPTLSTQKPFELLSGDDATYLPLLSIGATGVISVASNLFPEGMVALQKAFDENRIQQAMALHQFFYPLFRDLFIEANPTPVKYLLSKIDACRADVRLPLVPLSPANIQQLETSFHRCKDQIKVYS